MSPSEESRFFGPHPAELQAQADELGARLGDQSLAYADALMQVGTAHVVHISPPAAALQAMRKALAIYAAEVPDDKRTAEAHLGIASLLRRLGTYGEAAEHLRQALRILAMDEADKKAHAIWRKELEEVVALERETSRRRLPPD